MIWVSALYQTRYQMNSIKAYVHWIHVTNEFILYVNPFILRRQNAWIHVIYVIMHIQNWYSNSPWIHVTNEFISYMNPCILRHQNTWIHVIYECMHIQNWYSNSPCIGIGINPHTILDGTIHRFNWWHSHGIKWHRNGFPQIKC